MRFEPKEEAQANSAEKMWENGILADLKGFKKHNCHWRVKWMLKPGGSIIRML